MATIQNDRDALLQAAASRTVAVTLPSNVTVPSSQVPGLPDTIAATKRVELKSSSLVFQISKAGVVSPASITLTPVVYNMVGTPTLSVVAGTVTGTPPLPLVEGVCTLDPANMVTDTVTIRASVTVNSVTYTQDITISKVRDGVDGIDGIDAVFAALTKDSWVLPADSVGAVTSYSGASSKMTIYRGIVDETALWTLTSSNSVGVTAAAVNASGNVTVTGFSSANDTGSITITATRAGYPTLSRVFNISKAKSGATGSNGARGSMTFYVSSTTTAWSDTLANTTSNVNGGKSLNDQVTQFNNTAKWAETRFWDGSAWVVVTATINGNLLVDGSVGAGKVSATSLSAISANLGTITAGTLKTVSLMSGAFAGWAWPAAGNYGFYLGAEGLLMGNANNGKYVQITSSGDFYAPGLSIVNGSAVFSGSISASAANIINTINIAGNAVTIPVFNEMPYDYSFSGYTMSGSQEASYGNNGERYVDLISGQINSSGAPIVVVYSSPTPGALVETSGWSDTLGVALRVDGVTYKWLNILPDPSDGMKSGNSYSTSTQVTLGAGLHTISVSVVNIAPQNNYYYGNWFKVSAPANRSLLLLEVKR